MGIAINYSSKHFRAELAAFCRGSEVPREIADAVSGILADVRERGDAAVVHYAAKFDGAQLTADAAGLRVPVPELKAAMKRLPAAEKRALIAAHAAIVDFNRRGLPKAWSARNRHGARVGEKFDPIRRVGLYIPGGQVPLVSTVLMTATLARIAGCPEIAAFTPVGAGGTIADGLLAALHLVGVTEVYRIGGVQAIGAMAYGTETIPAVDKVFGPGNAYVCEAKRQVFGTVGVDSLPGPSEVMVIADATARPEFAAADLLAQAEHGSGREKIFLVALNYGRKEKLVRVGASRQRAATPSATMAGTGDGSSGNPGGPTSGVAVGGGESAIARAIHAAIEVQRVTLSRSEKMAKVLAEGFLTVEVASPAEAAEVANFVAPEHLELLVKPAVAKVLTKAITTAGAIMVGNFTPTALGDFAAGPSHVLPTARAGRFFSGLRVADFMRRTSVLAYEPGSLAKAAPTVAAFAAMEQLDAHGNSVAIRAERVANSRSSAATAKARRGAGR
jgi:histidinol dehydrogenase